MLDTLSRWKRKATSLSPFSTSSSPNHPSTSNIQDELIPWPSVAHRRTDIAQLTISQPIPRSSPASLSGFDPPSHNLGTSHAGPSGAGPGPGLGAGVNAVSSTLANEYPSPSFGLGTITPQVPYWQNFSLYGGSTGTSHSNSGSPASTGGGGVGRDKPPNVSWLSSVNEVEDNKPMGGLGRRRLGSGSSSSLAAQPYDPQPHSEQQDGLFPAVIRLDPDSTQYESYVFPHPPSQVYGSHLEGVQKRNLRLHTNVGSTGPGTGQGSGTLLYANSALNHSAHSLHLPASTNNTPPGISTGTGIPTLSTDVYANAYAYPMAKQLSPIAEQDYISPSDSLKKTRSILGSVSRNGTPDSGSGIGSTAGNVGTVISSSHGTGTRPGTGEGEGGSAVGRKSWTSASEESPGVASPATAAGGQSHHADQSLASASAGTPRSQHGNPSSGGSPSIVSEITRPSLAYGSPFITRQLNRTGSQTSSKTHTTNSTNTLPVVIGTPAGSVGRQSAAKPSTPTPTSTTASEPPMIPPLDLRPPFPGPHPSHIGPGPPLRPLKSKTKAVPAIMPKIPGSHEGYYDEAEGELDGASGMIDEEMMMYESGITDDQLSLHAESYVTASDKADMEGKETVRYADQVRERLMAESRSGNAAPGPSSGGIRGGIVIDVEYENGDIEAGGAQIHEGSSRLPSTSESFITRRWDRVNTSGLPTNGRMRRSITIFEAKKREFFVSFTPAFWAFWLGFICPVLWLVGGWHFTNFGEQPPKLSVWEFYFSAGFWQEMCCCCLARRKVPAARGKGKDVVVGTRGGSGKKDKELECDRKGKVYPPLPRWVAEKQSTDDGRARLNDPRRTLRGISFGYPFIARPPIITLGRSVLGRLARRVLNFVGRPNRLLDQLYGVKLKEVRGRPESGRRMFDPWVQRCRYAFCYALLLMAIGLCTASTYLIVYNTRELR